MAATSSSTSGAVKTQANWRKKRKPSTDTIASTTIITAAAGAAGEVSLIYPYNAYSHNANSPNHSRRKWLSEFVVRKD